MIAHLQHAVVGGSESMTDDGTQLDVCRPHKFTEITATAGHGGGGAVGRSSLPLSARVARDFRFRLLNRRDLAPCPPDRPPDLNAGRAAEGRFQFQIGTTSADCTGRGGLGHGGNLWMSRPPPTSRHVASFDVLLSRTLTRRAIVADLSNVEISRQRSR